MNVVDCATVNDMNKTTAFRFRSLTAPFAQRWNRIARTRLIVGLVLLLAALPWLRPARPLPPGGSTRGPARALPAGGARLLLDRTGWDPAAERRVIRQEIFDEALRMIADARRLIVVDFFLWNSWQGPEPETYRSLSAELSAALVARTAQSPDLEILVMTDPINRIYGRHEPADLAALRAAGIPLVYTDVARLRASNLVYSPAAETFGPWLARVPPVRQWLDRPRFRNPFDPRGERISAGESARLLHFRANHRKVLVADGPDGRLHVLVGSFNPSDASAAHANVAVRCAGAVAMDALASELDLMEWSLDGRYAPSPDEAARARDAIARIRSATATATPAAPSAGEPDGTAEWLTEGAVHRRLIELFDAMGPGDDARLALFYLSDRPVIRAMRGAAARGAQLRLILDPNRDAFGRVKNGIPNRVVAAELASASGRDGSPIEIRWADTHGEQFHPKAALFSPADGPAGLMIGSANWTRRNLRDLNLEANLFLEGAAALNTRFAEAFDRAWANEPDGLCRTVPYAEFAEPPFARLWKTWLYRIQEASGASTF